MFMLHWNVTADRFSQISKWNHKQDNRGFKIPRDLTTRCFFGYWIGFLGTSLVNTSWIFYENAGRGWPLRSASLNDVCVLFYVSCNQTALRIYIYVPRPSVRLSVTYHHEISRSYHYWLNWWPSIMWRSEVKGQGQIAHIKCCPNLDVSGP